MNTDMNTGTLEEIQYREIQYLWSQIEEMGNVISALCDFAESENNNRTDGGFSYELDHMIAEIRENLGIQKEKS